MTDSAQPLPIGAALHVGMDAEKIVVAPYPLKMRAGRAKRRRWGSITEVVPAAPSGRSRDDRRRAISQLGLALLVLSAVLTGAGIPWWSAAGGALALLVLVAREQSRAAAVGLLAVPRVRAGQPACHALYAREERAAFARSYAVAKRVRRTWPALRDMIDPVDAEPMLSRALWDLAAVLTRRQQLRRLRAELSAVDHRDLPAGSPDVADLLAQRSRVEALWREAGAEANRHIVAINAVAAAGEGLIREQSIGRTARAAERVIARLGASPALSAAGGPELADRTAAVIDAYRELSTRHPATG